MNYLPTGHFDSQGEPSSSRGHEAPMSRSAREPRAPRGEVSGADIIAGAIFHCLVYLATALKVGSRYWWKPKRNIWVLLEQQCQLQRYELFQ